MVRDQGVVEIWYGELADQKPQIDLVTDAVARTAASGPYSGGKRLYGYVKSDLMWVGEKSTPEVPLRPYMSAHLKKVVVARTQVEAWAKDLGRPSGRRHRLLQVGRFTGAGQAAGRRRSGVTSGRCAAGPSAPATGLGVSAPAYTGRVVSTDWKSDLRQRGYRLTPQRQLVLEAVDALEHATPDDILVRGAQDRLRGEHLHRVPDAGAAGGAGPGLATPISATALRRTTWRTATTTSTWSAGTVRA